MKKIALLLVGMMALVSCQKSDKTKYSPIDLKCEYAVNPTGVDTDAPRFTWRLPANSGVNMQERYQVLVGAKSSEITKGKSLVWDSGKNGVRGQPG